MSLDDARHHIIDKRDHPVAHEMLQKQVEVLEADYQKELYDEILNTIRTVFAPTTPQNIQSAEERFFAEKLRTFSLPELSVLARQLRVLSVHLHKLYHTENESDAKWKKGENKKRIEIAITISDLKKELESPKRYFKVPKWNSDLYTIVLQGSIFFRSTLNSVSSVETWHKASTCVPCTPLIPRRSGNAGDEITTQPSTHAIKRLDLNSGCGTTRYTGMEHAEIEQLAWEVSGPLHIHFETLLKQLRHARINTIAELLRHGIAHAHPHTSNFTVEFIRKESLESYAQSIGEPLYTGSLLNPKVVNLIPYRKDDFVFLTSMYLSNPDLYIPVSRIIDFDDSRNTLLLNRYDAKMKNSWYEEILDFYEKNEYLSKDDIAEIWNLLEHE